MAPIFTAKPVSGSNNITPLFKLKGIDNLAPAPISSLGIFGIPLERQVAYTEYSNNISYFIAASAGNRRVSINARPTGLPSFAHHLPLNPPQVDFTIQKEMGHDQSEAVVRSLGPGASKSRSGNTTIYHAPALDPKKAETIFKLSSSHFNVGRTAVNPAGYLAFTFLSGSIGELLRVHSYAAFQAESSETLVELKMLVNSGDARYYIYEDTEAEKASRVKESRILSELADRATNLDDMEDVTSDVPEMLKTASSAKGYISSGGKDMVATAKPPRGPVVNVGSSTSIPDSNGILFPYFHGLVQPDAQMLLAFTQKHLFYLLGKTIDECQTKFAELRRGFNSLSTHDVGMVLTHIVMGLDLALATQSRCFVIIDSNHYHGFALLGARFAIFNNTRWVAPEDEQSFREDLTALDPHAAAVRDLTARFGEMTSTGIYNGPAVSEQSFESPSDLIPIFEGLNLAKLGDLEAEINRLLRSLNYMGDGFIHKNPQSVAEILETIFSENTLVLSRPTYIPDVRTNIASREFIGLSKFGPEAPSFWNERGKDYQCVAKEAPIPSSGKRKMGQLDDFANLPERLLITPKPLSIAVKDLVKVIERRSVRMDLNERAGKNRNMSVQAEEMRKRIWKILVEGVAKSSSKKRRIMDDDDDNENGGVNLDALLSELTK